MNPRNLEQIFLEESRTKYQVVPRSENENVDSSCENQNQLMLDYLDYAVEHDLIGNGEIQNEEALIVFCNNHRQEHLLSTISDSKYDECSAFCCPFEYDPDQRCYMCTQLCEHDEEFDEDCEWCELAKTCHVHYSLMESSCRHKYTMNYDDYNTGFTLPQNKNYEQFLTNSFGLIYNGTEYFDIRSESPIGSLVVQY
jgi:hypothetical protein